MFELKNFDKGTLIHFIGIAGIGMSSIAEAMHKWGYKVQGSNNVENENVESLRKTGLRVIIGHSENNIVGAGIVVVSSAVPPDNAELVSARKTGIPVIERADMLNSIMNLCKGIAISGTHGKTTTTAMVGTMLDVAGLDPTIINGGIMLKYDAHNRIGNGDYVVAEACEAFGNIKYFSPWAAVITNIDAEHMEFYKTLDVLVQHFRDYLGKVPKDGLFVACADHPVVAELAEEFKARTNVITYGIDNPADIMARNIRVAADGQDFDVSVRGRIIRDLHIPMFGRHNVLNSLVAIAIAEFLNVSDEVIQASVREFVGCKHRFTTVAEVKGVKIVDDYGHHPKEISTTLDMACDVACGGKVYVVWEPHRYTRLTDLFDEFAKAFDVAEKVIILPVYTAGERPVGMKTSHDIAEALGPRAAEVYNFSEVAPLLASIVKPGDIIMSSSAGNLKNWIYTLPAELEKLL